MKETDCWVKIKKYTDDDSRPICGGCIMLQDSGERYECDFEGVGIYPGSSCPVWHGESKSEWQPIETAPKDCPVLVYAPGKEGLTALISTCKWHYQAGFCIDEIREPTHWMPLPSPPQEK